jgi:hypothetical protein
MRHCSVVKVIGHETDGHVLNKDRYGIMFLTKNKKINLRQRNVQLTLR